MLFGLVGLVRCGLMRSDAVWFGVGLVWLGWLRFVWVDPLRCNSMRRGTFSMEVRCCLVLLVWCGVVLVRCDAV